MWVVCTCVREEFDCRRGQRILYSPVAIIRSAILWVRWDFFPWGNTRRRLLTQCKETHFNISEFSLRRCFFIEMWTRTRCILMHSINRRWVMIFLEGSWRTKSECWFLWSTADEQLFERLSDGAAPRPQPSHPLYLSDQFLCRDELTVLATHGSASHYYQIYSAALQTWVDYVILGLPCLYNSFYSRRW